MTAYDYWKKHNLDFAAGVRLLNNAAALPKGINQRLLNNMNKVANHGGYVPDIHEGKLEIALKEIPWQASVSEITTIKMVQKPFDLGQTTMRTTARANLGGGICWK